MREELGERWPCLDHSFAAPPGDAAFAFGEVSGKPMEPREQHRAGQGGRKG